MSFDLERRTLLTLTAAQLLGCSAAAAPSSPKSAVPPPPTPPGSGKPGDLDFLTGEWKIKHRRLKAPGTWDEFEGEATCYSILQGIGSVEELRIPARDFSGMGLRLLDVERRVWSDFWVNAKSGVLTTPGVTGAFVDGVGTFTAPEVDASGQPILARGVWDQITPRSCRWRQGVSRDAGATWEDNWIMEWTRVK